MSTSINLLIIEDNPADLRLITRHLEKHGLAARCHCVVDIEGLEAAVEQGGWDAVLSDYSVPKLDFQHALGLVQARRPDLPVILVSGSVGEERAVELLKLGVWDFVLKDSLARLVPAIERSLREAGERRARRVNEAALRASEGEFRAMFETASIGIAQADPRTGQWLRVNQRLCAITGYSADEMLRLRISEITHPEDRRQDDAAFQRVVRGEAPDYQMEKRYVRRDGTTAWVNVNMTVIRDVAGHALRTMATIEDITGRKLAEEALRRYEMAMEQSSDGIAIADTEDRLRFVNHAWARMHGYETTEMIGQPLSINHTPEQVASDVIPFNDAVRKKGAHQGEIGHRRKDGSTFPAWMTGTVMKDNQGNPVGLVGIARDITERKRDEQERLRLGAAIEQANDAVVVTDRKSVIQYVNPAFERVTGYSRQEALGLNTRILKSGKHDAEFYRRMWATLAAGEVWSGHMINKRKDGTLYEEDATISPVRDRAGNVVNYVAVQRDVTHEANLEAQLRQAQKMEAVGRLAGGVAHDFNNLLTGIMNYVELCRDELPQEHPARGYLDEITRDAQRSADITKQLLAFARKQVIAPKVLDLNDALAGMLKMLQHLMGEDIGLTWAPGAALWRVEIDPGQLDQILANLCVNARDAIAGVGRVAIGTANTTLDQAHCAGRTGTAPGEYVRLAVSDTGCGMGDDVLAHLFEPFFTTKEVGKGTGLGLATVYGIVEQNHGHIEIHSEVGKGTTFSIYLPRAASESDTGSVAMAPEKPPRGTETILLAEDENSVRVTARLFLEALGYTVLAAGTPAESMRLAGAHAGPIHLLITDVIMPGMNGPDLAERLADQRPDLKSLFMSGYTADVMMQRGTLNEGKPFLSKPFSRHDLARKVREVLDGK